MYRKDFLKGYVFVLMIILISFAKISVMANDKAILIPAYKYDYERNWNLGGYIDMKGNFIIQPQFDYVDEFSEGLAVIELNNKYGFIDSEGNIVIEPRFDNKPNNFSEGLAAIEIDDKYGFINTKGELVVEPKFDLVGDFSEDLAFVEIKRKFGFINEQGEVVIPIKYDFFGIVQFSEGLVHVGVSENGKKSSFYIDKTGKRAIDYNITFGSDFKDGVAIGYIYENSIKGNKLIDKKGNILLDFKYKATYSEGKIKTGKNSTTWAFYDIHGKELFALPENVFPRDFSDGMAAVCNINIQKWGYINTKGELVVDYKYNSGDTLPSNIDFKKGYAIVRDKEMRKVINTKGEEIYSWYISPYNVIKILVDDKYIDFDVQPQMINNTTYIPLRDILDVLGYKVDFDSINNCISAHKGNNNLSVDLETGEMTINNSTVFQEYKPIIERGTILVPTRFIANASNSELKWDKETNTAYFITEK